MPPGTRVSGHSIVAQGAPHDEDGLNVNRNDRWPHSVHGVGIGLCTCGLASEVLPSAYQRRRWHKAHREGVWRAGPPPEAPAMTLRVRGHSLIDEGAPFERVATDLGVVARRLRGTREGRALCSCKVTSDVLRTTVERQRWHREHKAEVR